MSQVEHEPTGDGESPRVLVAILRMDLVGSSSLGDNDDRALNRFMEPLQEEVGKYPARFGRNEGEGDSIRQAFTDLKVALRCAFYLRTAAQQPVETDDGLYGLAPRIALHFGGLVKYKDDRAGGREQITVSRLDHAIPPGAIWATEAFFDVARHVGADQGFSFAYVGQQELEKDWGRYPCYAVTLANEATPPRSIRRPYDPVELATRLFARGDLSSQASAVEVLGTIDSEAASRELLEIALQPEVERRVRHAALVKLQDRGEDIDIEGVSEKAQDPAAPVETRALLLLVLGATGSKDVFDTLSNILTRSPPQDVRLQEAALLAMRGLNGARIDGVVQNALNSEEYDVRRAACVAAASGRVHSTGVQDGLYDIVTNAKADSPMELRSVACEALASQPLTTALSKRLEGLVQDRDLPLTLRRYALDGLAPSDDPRAVRAVEEVARRTDDELQVEAIGVLAAMRAPRRGVRRRAQQPTSHLAEVIELRTRPQAGGAEAPGQ